MPLLVWILCGIAAAAVLVGVVVTVMGRGGRLARYEADYAPPELPATRAVVAGDVATLRLPLALWGYHVRAVDEVLEHLAETLRERDRRIAALEEQVVGTRPSAPAARRLPADAEPPAQSEYSADTDPAEGLAAGEDSGAGREA